VELRKNRQRRLGDDTPASEWSRYARTVCTLPHSTEWVSPDRDVCRRKPTFRPHAQWASSQVRRRCPWDRADQ